MTTELIKKLQTLKSKVEELSKWERTGSMTMLNREAHLQALATVKDHVLQYVMNLVHGMQNEEVREAIIAGRTLNIRKLMQDMYSGKIVLGTDIVHQFDRITIPQLASQLQSLLELYNPDSLPEGESDPKAMLIEKLKPFAEQAKDGMVSQLISILNNEPPKVVVATPDDDIKQIIAEAQEITEQARRNVGSPDPREEIEKLKSRVREMLHRVESLVSSMAPTSKEDDLLQDTIHQIQVKHDLLVDRVQQELNILDDKIAEANKKLSGAPSGKTITIRID